MSSLGNDEKLYLLKMARQSLLAAVERREFTGTDSTGSLGGECTGAFVTLRRGKRLRGCIGQIGTRQLTVDLVTYAARAAALEDPRFEPVQLVELQEIEIELSILSAPAAIAPSQIKAGEHGLIVSRGLQRGLLLPQVALEHRWDGLRLLEETCVKAGLERDAWKDPRTQILAFTADVFSESELGLGAKIESPTLLGSGYSSST